MPNKNLKTRKISNKRQKSPEKTMEAVSGTLLFLLIIGLPFISSDAGEEYIVFVLAGIFIFSIICGLIFK
jgi:hypothetical protein